jgi:hypothetical protein
MNAMCTTPPNSSDADEPDDELFLGCGKLRRIVTPEAADVAKI